MEFNATFLVSVISFLVFVAIMNKIFYTPLTNVVCERKEILDGNYHEAEKFNSDAEQILRERDEKLAEAEDQSRKIITDKMDRSNADSKVLTSEAASKSAEEIKNRKSALADERISAKSELDSKVLGLAERISSKVLGFDVKIDDTTQLNGIKL